MLTFFSTYAWNRLSFFYHSRKVKVTPWTLSNMDQKVNFVEPPLARIWILKKSIWIRIFTVIYGLVQAVHSGSRWQYTADGTAVPSQEPRQRSLSFHPSSSGWNGHGLFLALGSKSDLFWLRLSFGSGKKDPDPATPNRRLK